MTKKLRIIITLFILAFSFVVKADVFMELDCDSKNIIAGNNITCDVNLIHEKVNISEIEFDYITNLDVDVIPLHGFNLDRQSNKISIHLDSILYDEIMNNTTIMKFILKSNNKTIDNESFILKNIIVNKSSDILIEDTSEVFSIQNNSILDNNCSLDTITIDKVSISNFNRDILEYKDIKVDKDVVFIDAIRSSDKSSAMGLGEVFIKPGDGIEHHIDVVAPDGTRKTYKLFITNTGGNKELSNDNKIKYLEILNNKEIIPFIFDNKLDSFNINVENVNKLTIRAVLNDNKATFVSSYGPRDVDLKPGNNKILIKVKAENNSEKVYTLNINVKDDLMDNNELSLLKINNHEVDLDSNNLEIILPNDINRTEIMAISKNLDAKVIYEDSNLIIGNNKITIEVISVSGKSKIYEVNVIREEVALSDISENKKMTISQCNDLITIISYSILGLGILGIICSIIYLKKKSKTTIL